MRILLRSITVQLVILSLLVPGLTVFAQEPEARILSVYRVDGDDAFLTWGLGGRGVEPRSGQRLGAGNVMSTGLDTQVYMLLDRASIVKMDELSQVSVVAAGDRLALTVSSGSALVEVAEQAPGQTLETRIGSTVMTVRGTLFVASLRDTGAAVFTMLSGEGVVQVIDEAGVVQLEQPLRAGYVFSVDDAAVADSRVEVRPVSLRAMSTFELQETWNYREYLIEVGTLTPAMQQELPQLIDVALDEIDAEPAEVDVPDYIPEPDEAEYEPVQEYQPEEVMLVDPGAITGTWETEPLMMWEWSGRLDRVVFNEDGSGIWSGYSFRYDGDFIDDDFRISGERNVQRHMGSHSQLFSWQAVDGSTIRLFNVKEYSTSEFEITVRDGVDVLRFNFGFPSRVGTATGVNPLVGVWESASYDEYDGGIWWWRDRWQFNEDGSGQVTHAWNERLYVGRYTAGSFTRDFEWRIHGSYLSMFMEEVDVIPVQLVSDGTNDTLWIDGYRSLERSVKGPGLHPLHGVWEFTHTEYYEYDGRQVWWTHAMTLVLNEDGSGFIRHFESSWDFEGWEELAHFTWEECDEGMLWIFPLYYFALDLNYDNRGISRLVPTDDSWGRMNQTIYRIPGR